MYILFFFDVVYLSVEIPQRIPKVTFFFQFAFEELKKFLRITSMLLSTEASKRHVLVSINMAYKLKINRFHESSRRTTNY